MTRRASSGCIAQISVSAGGVPKRPTDRAEVTVDGLVGDRQAHRIIHGGPKRALCLWSTDVIEQLQQEGHPIAAGMAGENVTVSGIDWGRVLPGVELRLGDHVELAITSYTAPCRENARWFSDGRFVRISHKRHPGSSRVYARVLEPGAIRVGDIVLFGR